MACAARMLPNLLCLTDKELSPTPSTALLRRRLHVYESSCSLVHGHKFSGAETPR
jgi:hypothetical protein